MLKVLVLSLALASYAFAANIGFAVVAGDSPVTVDVKVIIGATSYTLTKPYADVPYFTGVVSDAPAAPFTYKYSVAGAAEAFDRTFTVEQGSQTFNEFYGRQDTVKKMFQFARPFTTQPTWTRNLGPNGVYDDDYISTLFITGADAVSCFGTPGGNCYGSFTTTIISKYDVGRMDGTDKPSISSKAGYEPKIQFNMYLKKNYRGRASYKLRPSAYDPIFFRENLYNSVLQAMGVPHQETSPIRVYIGTTGLGLYHLQEITGSFDFAATQFYGRNRNFPATLGEYYECSTGADIYSPVPNAFGQEFSRDSIGRLVTAFEALPATFTQAQLDEFNTNWFDVETFLRAMSMEYMTGHWDSYWFYTSNFVMFHDTTEGTNSDKYYFVDQDFDQTFGADISASDDMGSNYINKLYPEFVNRGSWANGHATGRSLIDKFLTNPIIKARFDEIVKSLVKSIFNPLAMARRIDDLRDRLRPEVAWDRALGANRAHLGNTDPNNNPDREVQGTQYTLADFDTNFQTSIGGIYGLKDYVQKRAAIIAASYGGITYEAIEGTGEDAPVTSTGQVIGSGNQPAATTGSQSGTVTSGVVSETTTSGSNSDPAATTGDVIPGPDSTTGTTGNTETPAITSGDPSNTGLPDGEISSSIRVQIASALCALLLVVLF